MQRGRAVGDCRRARLQALTRISAVNFWILLQAASS